MLEKDAMATDLTPPLEVSMSIDLSHHLNQHSKARHPSPLKEIIKFMGYEGMVSLAGGLPHPSLFPFQNASVHTYPASTILSPSGAFLDTLEEMTLTKEARPDQLLSLSTALQYGGGSGDASICKWAHEFTKTVFKPAFGDFEVILNSGNTDAWCKVVRLLCEPGDFILCEQYTYPSAQALWIPMGCKAAPIKIDSRGLRPDDLERVLANWDTVHPGVRRPHLLYIVPVGSNPTGLTMDGMRRKEIYDLCVKYDIIICEDDPYTFLQFPVYSIGETAALGPTTPTEYLSSLAPSFLEFDTQGRVIRLDTFSKTLAPGTRLGYFVANPIFIERLLRATEVESQAPSGWSQAIVMSLLSKWGTFGYVEWLSNLRGQYFMRRNWMCDALTTDFTIKEASGSAVPGAEGLIAFEKDAETTRPLFSFVPPTGGMFIWARFYFSSFPGFEKLQASVECTDPEQTFEDDLWAQLAKALVLLTPGSYYEPWQGKDKMTTTSTRGGEKGVGNFRLAYSMTTKEEMELGIKRMAIVLKQAVRS